jgi:hypothetical protein
MYNGQCDKQRQIERDRRDLQDYAVRYFKDPEETELSTCAEFADDFLSEYPRFKVVCLLSLRILHVADFYRRAKRARLKRIAITFVKREV